MCSKCNFRQFYKFESETAWKNFDLDFTKTYINELLLIKQNHLNSNSISPYDLYKCKSCDNLWAYSYPENAWRGFFLPEKLAIEYEKKLKRGDRIKGVVGLTILLFIFIAILRSCMK
jgi:hypothetical protein